MQDLACPMLCSNGRRNHMMTLRTGSTLAAIALSPMIATAEPAYEPVPASANTTFEDIGASISAGGGVEGFTSDSMRRTTSDGGDWGVRAAIGTRSFVGFEAAYIGSAQAIDTLGLDNNAVLVGNGAQGAVRLNATTNMEVQPFLFAGLAWRHYKLTNADFNTSDVSDSDDVLEIPMGVGLAYKYRGLLLDARGEFRAATGEDLMPSLNSTDPNDKASMHRWGVNANLGYEF
jgi:hypothetical protein